MLSSESQTRLKNDEVVDIPVEEQKSNSVSYGWIHLVVGTIGVLSGSSITPIFGLFPEVDTLIKNFWRCQLVFILSLPICFFMILRSKDTINWTEVRSVKSILNLLLVSVILNVGQQMYYSSSSYTLISHTVILSNLAGICIIIYQ